MSNRINPSDFCDYHERNVAFHDVRRRHSWRLYYHDLYQIIGNELKFSPGFWTDMWAYLSNDISIAYLVVMYFLFEVVFILIFGMLIFIAQGINPGRFANCVLASARAVTMLANWGSNQFLFVEDNQPEKLRSIGAILLMLEGFLHFMFVCVASSLIIVRALRPLQQVTFSHHCCLTDEELVVRIRILRPSKTVLIRPEVKLDVCLTNGTFVKLRLVGDGCYAKWSGNPTITIRHKIEEDSPFFLRVSDDLNYKEGVQQVKSTLEGIAHLSCSLVATDANGIPIAEVQHYTPMVGFSKMVMGPYLESNESILDDFPQILHYCKFQDQIRFGVASTEDLARNSRWPWHPHGSVENIVLRRKTDAKNRCLFGDEIPAKRLVTDSDNFCRIGHVESDIGKSSTSHSRVVEGIERQRT